MKRLTVCVFVFVLLTCESGFSTVQICGNHYNSATGVTSRYCFLLGGKCNDEQLLNNAAWFYPGGWTCMEFLANTGINDTHLIKKDDGKAVVNANGRTTNVGSDALFEFMTIIQKETTNTRMGIDAVKRRIDAFLDTDNGYVSDARLNELSMELGVPIEVEGSPNPRVVPGTGRGSASRPYTTDSGESKVGQGNSSADSDSRRPDHCSLPDCSCRVVNTAGDLLCKGGTEEETSAGVHYCKCGKFGAPSVQSGGAGGVFTVGFAGATGRNNPAEGVMSAVSQGAFDSSTGVLRTEGRQAAALLCRDVEMYRRSRQVATSPGGRPPFSSVEPLCALADSPQRIQNFRCSGGKGDSNGRCADSWWESVWDGLSYCEDLKILCETAGAKWSTQ